MNNLPAFAFILAALAPVSVGAAPEPNTSEEQNAAETVIANAEVAAEGEVEADAEEVDEEETEREPYELPHGMSASISTGLSFTAGNLRPGLPATEQDDSLLNTWGFSFSKEFVEGFSGSLSWGINKFLTVAGGSTYTHEARINNLGVRLSYGPVYVIPVADIRISASLGSTVPLTRSARTSTLRTTLSPGLSFSRSFGNFGLSGSISGTKRFHRYTSSVLDATDVEILRREGGAEDISANLVAASGINTEWSMGTGLSASYSFLDGFSASVAWNYGRSWAYDVTPDRCDEFSAENARCGRIARDAMTGSLGLGYSFRDRYSVSLSASTSQQPKTADNRRVRFPFWDLNTPGLYNTSLGIDFSASL